MNFDNIMDSRDKAYFDKSDADIALDEACCDPWGEFIRDGEITLATWRNNYGSSSKYITYYLEDLIQEVQEKHPDLSYDQTLEHIYGCYFRDMYELSCEVEQYNDY